MGAEQIRSIDPDQTPLTVRHAPHTGQTDCHAVAVTQSATSGRGCVLHAESYNPDVPAAVVRGRGDLLDLRDAAGVSRFRVHQTGEVTVGDVAGHARVVYKTADEQVTSSVTVQDDDHLTLPVTAGGAYTIEACLLFDSEDAAADLRLTFAAPAGASGWWAPVGITLGNVDGTGSVRLTRFDLGAEATIGAIAAGSLALPRGYLTVGDTAGSFTLRWAQAVSSATAVTVRAGSWLRLHRMA